MTIKTSEAVGITYDKNRNKWKAYIKAEHKQKHLGYFDELKDAVIARYQAEQKYDMVKKDNMFGAYQWLRWKRLLDKNDNVKGLIL